MKTHAGSTPVPSATSSADALAKVDYRCLLDYKTTVRHLHLLALIGWCVVVRYTSQMTDPRNFFLRKRAVKAANYISPFIEENQRVLDFGCGDMLVSDELLRQKKLMLQAIDVIDIRRVKLPFQPYDGQKIPFPDKSFDVTFASYVLHHTTDIQALVREMIRVTTKRIILLEDVYSNEVELTMARVCDYGNMMLSREMNITLNFLSLDQWQQLFKELGISRVKITPIHPAIVTPTRHARLVADLH